MSGRAEDEIWLLDDELAQRGIVDCLKTLQNADRKLGAGMVEQRVQISSMERSFAKPVRNQAIEALRIVSAYGIVAFHSGARFHDLANSGLIVFLILAPVADLGFNWHRVRSVSRLALIMLVPWAFWLIAYGLRNILMHRGFFSSLDPITGLLFGTSGHLWFLPFIFIVLVLTNAIKQRMDPRVLFWAATVAAIGLLVTVTVWRAPSLTWPLPLPQWMHASPAICIGIVLGLSGRVGKAALASGLAVSGALLVAILAWLPGIGIPYTTGTVLTAAAISPLARRISANWNVQPIADCMLGVFLTHFFWLQIVGVAFGKSNYLTVTTAFLASLISVFVARKMLPASKLVLG